MGFVSLSFPYGMFVSQGLCLELISLHTTLDFNEMVSLCTLFLLSSMFCVLSPYEKAAVQMWFKTNSKFQNFTTLSLLHSYFLESGKFKIKVTLPRKKTKSNFGLKCRFSTCLFWRTIAQPQGLPRRVDKKYHCFLTWGNMASLTDLG